MSDLWRRQSALEGRSPCLLVIPRSSVTKWWRSPVVVRLRPPRSCWTSRTSPARAIRCIAPTSRKALLRWPRASKRSPKRGLPGAGNCPTSSLRSDANPTGVLPANADTARLPTAEGRLCAVKDCCPKRISDSPVGSPMRHSRAVAALPMAIRRRKPKTGLGGHSDTASGVRLTHACRGTCRTASHPRRLAAFREPAAAQEVPVASPAEDEYAFTACRADLHVSRGGP